MSDRWPTSPPGMALRRIADDIGISGWPGYANVLKEHADLFDQLRARAEAAEAIVAAARAVVDEAVALREMHQISNRVPVPSGQFRLLLEVLSSALEDGAT